MPPGYKSSRSPRYPLEVQTDRHQHSQQCEQKLPQGQTEEQSFLVVLDFFVDAGFYGYHLREN